MAPRLVEMSRVAPPQAILQSSNGRHSAALCDATRREAGLSGPGVEEEGAPTLRHSPYQAGREGGVQSCTVFCGKGHSIDNRPTEVYNLWS